MQRPVSLHGGYRGQTFVRSIICRAVSIATPSAGMPAQIASDRWPQDVDTLALLKNVHAGSMGGTTWADQLSVPQAGGEFFAAVVEQSVLGRLQGVRKTPLNVRVIVEGQPTTAYWVAEGKPAKATSAFYSASILAPLKVNALCVISDELLRFANPESEALIKTDLTNAIVRILDVSLLDPANGGSAGVSPASITNGVAALAFAAMDEGNIRAGIADLINGFAGDLSKAFFVMRPEIGAALTSPVDTNVGARGGELRGVPVLTSRYAPDDSVILIDPSQLALGGGTIESDISQSGTIEMYSSTSSQDADAGVGTQQISLFQCNAVAIKLTCFANWKMARAGAVSMIGHASSSGSI